MVKRLYGVAAAMAGCALIMARVASAADTTAPTTPTGVSAAAVSSSQINVSWTKSTDNVGVTGYRLERCSGSGCTSFAQIAAPTTTSYSDTGRAPATTYRYRVRATDAAGNLSGYSSIVTGTTPADTTAPSAPTGLTATVVSSTQINLSWTASTDNVGVTGYQLERCSGSGCTSFAQIATPTATSYSDTGRAPATIYRYRVLATDAAGNLSSYSAIVTGTTSADTTAPSAPTGLTATVVSSTQINLGWTASTDNVGVTSYRVERCSGANCTTYTQIGTTSGATSFSNTGLSAATTYRYRVRANDAAGNLSGYSSVVTATTSAADTQAPTAPTGLVLTVVSSTQINLGWVASADNVGVTGYRVQRCSGASCSTFAQVATPTATSYSDTGLTVSTTYSYRVQATDAAGNLSGYSSTATAATNPATSTYTYTYDGNGRLQTATTLSGSVIQYTYDSVGNVIGIHTTP